MRRLLRRRLLSHLHQSKPVKRPPPADEAAQRIHPAVRPAGRSYPQGRSTAALVMAPSPLRLSLPGPSCAQPPRAQKQSLICAARAEPRVAPRMHACACCKLLHLTSTGLFLAAGKLCVHTVRIAPTDPTCMPPVAQNVQAAPYYSLLTSSRSTLHEL